ncbi:hypothetical protein EXIGLDRAFT_829268 [Exidia glandulosa HHB12029]|uniref:Protein kinase domain-containing protein n=1 Tax=Exidia glandulosa HHB12029 TaxID=1314781 RepID=A0A165PM75_EXIGL|nr:hypothetical protein EXIGLDRAFT_829268 [Exidia glandulosa HHB12029]
MTAILEQLLNWPNPPNHRAGVSASAVPLDLHKGRIIEAHPGTELSELDQSLRSVFKRLRFARLRNVAESPLDWPSWLTIFMAWAEQFCFRPADCGDLDVGMTVLQSDLPNGGVLLNFVLGNRYVRNRTWYPYLVENSGTVCDYSRHALCLCTVICLPRGSLPPLPHEELIFYIKDDMTPLQSIFFSLISRCEDVSSRFGIITDGVHTIFVRVMPSRHRLPPARDVCFQLVASSAYPLAYCIFTVMGYLSRRLQGFDEQLSGAPNIGLSYNDPAREFRDFDMFHLEIDRVMYWKFLQWKNEMATRALSALPRVGSVFAVHRRDVLSLENGMFPPLRCNSPIWPLSDATRLALDFRLRPMNQDLCAILASQQPLAFDVSEIKQQGPNMWSQVYFGRLGISGEPVVDEEVCLKLFDERLFPVPSLERYDDEEVGFQLSGLRCADVLLRQEESVYARLSTHHGRQLPWCYGFHQFTLSDGQTVVGVLLEKIKGETLGKTLESLKSIQWSTPHALNLLRRIRHLTKVLTHAGIKQPDWHEDQIICVPQAEQHDSVCDVDPVMLDFAFATQVWGQEEGAMQPETGEIAQFARMLGTYGASDEMLADAG